MIDTIRLRNFKCLEDTKKLDIKPLTILCGANSSGKSSIIQSLLMLKQTFESQSRYKNIVLNGQFVHSGSFEDLVFMKNPENSVQISFGIDVKNPFSNRTLGSVNLWRKTDQKIEINRSVMEKRLLEMDIGLKTSQYSKDKDPHIDNFEVKAKYLLKSGTYLECAEIKYEKKENNEYLVSWKNIYPFLPDAFRVDLPKEPETYSCPLCAKRSADLKQAIDSQHTTESQLGKDHYRYYYYLNFCSDNACKVKASFINLFPEVEISNNRAFLTSSYNHVEKSIFSLRRILQQEFSNLFYIGPLREEPSRRYISEDEKMSIGNRGQNAPFILAVERETKISPFYIFNSSEEKWEKIEGDTLEKGVNRWLVYMGISDRCELTTDKEIIRLYLPTYADKNVKATLADVGFGVSQILPILVEGLRIRSSQTLILEQPEIHLHPKLQMQLADFFISMILSGKNVILETHSDHIINRISRRVIEDEENKIVSKTNILFFEQGHEGSVIKTVEFDPYRGVVNWPTGFFDQSVEEKRVILAKGIERRTKESIPKAKTTSLFEFK